MFKEKMLQTMKKVDKFKGPQDKMTRTKTNTYNSKNHTEQQAVTDI